MHRPEMEASHREAAEELLPASRCSQTVFGTRLYQRLQGTGPKGIAEAFGGFESAVPRLNIPTPVLEDRNVEEDDIGVIQTLCDFNTINFDRLPE